MAMAKFVEIKRHIVAKIESGCWREDHKLPSENQLAKAFSCSRMTARRALTELTEIGVLRRSQGLGTFVASHKSQSSMLVIRDISHEIQARGHGYSVVLLALTQRSIDEANAINLGVNEGCRVFYSKLLHVEQGVPLQIEERYVDPHRVPHYLEQDFNQLTPHAYLSQVAPLTQAEHTIEAILADNRQCALLQIAANEPCLQISRRTWSSQGVVSFARLIHPGSRFKLDGKLFLNNEPN
ncbi:histidine utilization repressor [Shewanella surugensis]|uniref:Histidine utilization repressor n=1 Tax=Shewanella surugensis TaxID=212020 RepID=A0ABT0L8M8_9GAMM|nr:histidine utilization repressor [Shewanella surugensis]MCL1124049.1 histidine utilization repressor [Shewanella surugensis]